VPLTGPTRLSVPSLLSVTHTEPSPTATPLGPLPTEIACTTRLAVGSILESVRLKLFATHTAPAPTAIPLGVESTWIVCSTAWVSESTRDTVPSL
jgi:hypothetical protein